MEPGWIWVEHPLQVDVLQPFNPSGSAIRRLSNDPKWPQKAINETNRAIRCSGGPKLVDLSGSRLDLGGIHPGGCVSTF